MAISIAVFDTERWQSVKCQRSPGVCGPQRYSGAAKRLPQFSLQSKDAPVQSVERQDGAEVGIVVICFSRNLHFKLSERRQHALALLGGDLRFLDLLFYQARVIQQAKSDPLANGVLLVEDLRIGDHFAGVGQLQRLLLASVDLDLVCERIGLIDDH